MIRVDRVSQTMRLLFTRRGLGFPMCRNEYSGILKRSRDVREHIYHPRPDKEQCNHDKYSDEYDDERILHKTLATFVECLH